MCHPRNLKKGGLPPLKIIFLGLYGKTGERRHEMLCLNNNRPINKNVTRFEITELYSKKVPLFTPPYPKQRMKNSNGREEIKYVKRVRNHIIKAKNKLKQ